MLTYTPKSASAHSPVKEQDKPWLLVLLCLFWLLPGLVGHDPWKPEENENAALVISLLRSNNWVVPYLADQPYFETAPLYFWIAASLANALTWFGIAVHDAARLTSGLWMGMAFWGAGLAGREIFGHRFGRLTVVLLLGSLGLLVWGHHIAPAVLLVAANAWLIYALALSLRQPLWAGVLLGLSLLVMLLGATWADALLGLMVALGILVLPQWRKSTALVTIVTAIIIALPLAALWGYALQSQSPVLFQAWWRNFAWGAYGGAQTVQWLQQPGYLLSLLPWFAWPVLPLAMWSLWINRAELQFNSRWSLLLWFTSAQFIFVFFAGHTSEAIALPLLIAFSLIATRGVDDLRRGAASALNSFAILTFGLGAVTLWLIWGMLFFEQPQVVKYFSRYSSASIAVDPYGFIFAFIATVLWGGVLLRRRAMGRKALTNWGCGLILVLAVTVGLFQDWINAGKTYRPVADAVHILVSKIQPGCIDAVGLPSAPLGAIAYFGTAKLETDPANECAMAIRAASNVPKQPWTALAQARRLGESKESFVIYLK
ncbi:hypothetical protein HZU75_13535 [Chitinibacter fontanus]|uniref:Glycosyltransferase family 39 protein n=1 Tax=Chitinibacter fontanus TaxID=1737446 RepID=A0A7D5ZF43_9NEIS|nr:hypothetical protein [Chitinibacter fontanus]QLI82466.1 hypothetical protein HZU75_13535 [Chitinibacter fontanus]